VSPRRRAEALLLAVTLIWGSTFLITKSLLADASPLFYTFIRFAGAALIILALFPRRVFAAGRRSMIHGTVLGLFLFVGFALQTFGLEITTASKSAFFTGMLVVFTPMVHVVASRWLPLIDRKPLRVGNLAGALFAAAGLYLLTAPSGGINVGDVMTLGGALLFAFYIVYLDWCGRDLDKMQLTFATFGSCALAAGASMLAFETMRFSPDAAFLTGLGYLTVFATVIALGVQNRYQGDTTPTRAAVIYAFEPVVAAILGWVVAGEVLGVAGTAGGVIILGGLLLSELSDSFRWSAAVVGGSGETPGPRR
jgi:drug/metabolite transporter (DMT)-like permease